jgi:choline kinase
VRALGTYDRFPNRRPGETFAVIGIVLAAGAGSRLRPLTDELPKTLLPVDGERTILELVVASLQAGGVEQAVVVTGFAADRVEKVLPDIVTATGLALSTLHNEHALDRNNAFSLWLAREHLEGGAVVANGDTIVPAPALRSWLDAVEPVGDLTIALDDCKRLGAEEMKVVHADGGRVLRISKQIEPQTANGEYIGVCVVPGGVAARVVDALAHTWQRDSTLYYEDGFQEYIDRGGRVVAAPIGDVEWVEVDDHDDLARARALRCRS